MKYAYFIALVVLLSVVSLAQVSAAVLWSEGFENRNIGTIDMNDTYGPNKSANGNLAGNPWWGTMPGNGEVETEDGNYGTPVSPACTPHSGSKMMGGWVGNALNYVNLAYRFNNNNKLSSKIALDWWFFDFRGADGNYTVNQGYCADAVSLANFTAAAISQDYPSLANSRNFTDSDFAQKIALGCSKDVSTGFDKTKYQARITGISGLDGQYGTKGWINLNITRSVGWHHGRIMVGGTKTNGNNDISFFIDDMNNALLTTDSIVPVSLNLMEVVSMVTVPDPNSTTGGRLPWSHPMCWDDFTLSTVPEPCSMVALSAGLVALLGLKKRRG